MKDKMKRIFIIFILLFELAGCCSYIDSLEHWHYKNWESLEFTKNYCIYNYDSPRIGVCDKELQVPAHYQIYIPNKLKMMGGVDFDRFFYIQKTGGLPFSKTFSHTKENIQMDLGKSQMILLEVS